MRLALAHAGDLQKLLFVRRHFGAHIAQSGVGENNVGRYARFCGKRGTQLFQPCEKLRVGIACGLVRLLRFFLRHGNTHFKAFFPEQNRPRVLRQL